MYCTYIIQCIIFYTCEISISSGSDASLEAVWGKILLKNQYMEWLYCHIPLGGHFKYCPFFFFGVWFRKKKWHRKSWHTQENWKMPLLPRKLRVVSNFQIVWKVSLRISNHKYKINIRGCEEFHRWSNNWKFFSPKKLSRVHRKIPYS